MIILETNVISEMMRPAPDTNVRAWLNARDAATLATTAITIAELRAGLDSLPDGRRKADLWQRFDRMMALFAARILDFDLGAAVAFGTIMGEAKRGGLAIGFADGLIAAIARDGNHTVASRDVGAFDAAGILAINPWRAE